MRAAIFNPYWDTLGGGERYSIVFAKCLSDMGYRIDIQWKDSDLKDKLIKRFGIDFSAITIIPDIKKGDGYDICFWLSDGSIPLLKSRKNILHFQFPFQNVGGATLINRMKMSRINCVVVNSRFTKSFIDREYKVNSKVIYPPIDTNNFTPLKKKNIILYVGRFSQLTQSKKQDVLVSAYKKLSDMGFKKWKLILAGGVEIGAEEYLKKIKKNIRNYNIEIVESPPFAILKKLYGSAKIFWSASGYKVDEVKEPTKAEHFGISPVEAMSAGCVPLIYNAGGHKEIIESGKNGFLWSSTFELINNTKDLIKDKNLLNTIGSKAILSSKKYGYDQFFKEVSEII